MPDYRHTLLCVDAHALLYRGHYAFANRPLLSANGDNTSAIFGCMRTLLEAVRTVRPTHLAVAVDRGSKTFRHRLFADYKAQRPPSPASVRFGSAQLRLILKSLGVQVLESDEYEADDLIGSVSFRFASAETEVVLLSPDKDYLQLLGPHVRIIKPAKSGGFETITESALCAKYGIQRPEQFVDILALWGDVADNVPGVQGVGEKTAAKLIAKYGSVSSILAHHLDLSEKQQSAFRAAHEWLPLAQKLVRIETGAPIPESLGEYHFGDADCEELDGLLSHLSFSALRAEIYRDILNAPVTKGQSEAENAPFAFTEVVSPEQFALALDALREEDRLWIFPVTTERGLREALPTALAFAGEQTGIFAFSLPNHQLPEWANPLGGLIAEKPIGGYNLKRAIELLLPLGLSPRGPYLDTMLLHYVLFPDSLHPLGSLAPVGVTSQGTDPYVVPVGVGCCEWASRQLNLALPTGLPLLENVTKNGLLELYNRIEAPLIPILATMEWEGVALLPERLEALAWELNGKVEEIRGRINGYAHGMRFNVDSPRQVGEFLFEHLKVAEGVTPPPKRTATGQYDTSEQQLARFAEQHAAVPLILQYREYRKLLSTYVEALPRQISRATGRIHAKFNQAITATGRLSSSDPNMQNIPVRHEVGRQIRHAFVPSTPGGILLSADYSQVELRIMAHISHDPRMLEDFDHGGDIHRGTAARIFGIPKERVTKQQRETAKKANFGMIYGISSYGLSQQLGLSVSEAKKLINDYFNTYQGVAAFMERAVEEAKESGFATTLLGRRRPIHNLSSSNQNVRMAARRLAINTPIQGTAADIMKLAMIRTASMLRESGLSAKIILQVHDELILDLPAAQVGATIPLVREAMEQAFRLDVPLTVDTSTADNWGDL